MGRFIKSVVSGNKQQQGKLGIIIGIIAVGALLVGAAVLLLNSSKTPRYKGPVNKVVIRLNWLHQAQYAGIYTAIEKGFYQDAGLAVDILEYEEGLDQNEELASGKTDFAISTPIELIAAIDSGKKLKAVAAIHQIAPWAIASLKSEGVTTPSDFNGKILGAMGGNKEAITKYGVLLRQYEIEAEIAELGFESNEADHLLNGDADTIDLYRIDQPYILKERGIEYNLILPENFGITTYGDVILASEDMISANPDLVKRFVQATMKGWRYVFENTEEALKYVEKFQNKDYNDPERQRFILTQSLPLIQNTGNQPLGSMNFSVWNQTLRAVEAAKLLKEDIEVSNIYTSKFTNEN